jgi:hypothetical protein
MVPFGQEEEGRKRVEESVKRREKEEMGETCVRERERERERERRKEKI